MPEQNGQSAIGANVPQQRETLDQRIEKVRGGAMQPGQEPQPQDTSTDSVNPWDEVIDSVVSGDQGQPADDESQEGRLARMEKRFSELQAENDRLRNQYERVAADAQLGASMRSGSLEGMSANQVTQQAILKGVVGRVNREAGLPSDFRPDNDELFTEGTDSNRWFQTYMQVHSLMVHEQLMKEERLTMRVEEDKRTFLSKPGRTEKDFAELVKFINDPNVWNLEAFWRFKNMDAIIKRTLERAGGAGPMRRPSIAAMPGTSQRKPASNKFEDQVRQGIMESVHDDTRSLSARYPRK